MLDQFGTTSPDGIAMANRQIRNQTVSSISRRLADARTRQQLSVIDELIALLEERNLDGERRIDHVVRMWLRRLETEIGAPVPRQVLGARNTVRLHGALLDWMETALDELIRQRRGPAGDPDLD